MRSRSVERIRSCASPPVKEENNNKHVDQIIRKPAVKVNDDAFTTRPTSLSQMLTSLDMRKHLDVLVLNGYEDLTLLKDLDEEELDYLGIVDEEERDKLKTMSTFFILGD